MTKKSCSQRSFGQVLLAGSLADLQVNDCPDEFRTPASSENSGHKEEPCP